MNFFPGENDFIDIHSHHAEGETGVFRIHNVFSSDYPQFPSDKPISIGLHPWHISKEAITELPEVLRIVPSLPNILAIGEAGLDSIIKTPLSEQLIVFRSQVEAAIEHGKPMIIHCVKAFPELLNLRGEYPNATPWIIHGFNSNQSVAGECVKMGIYISLSQRLFRNPDKALQISRSVPLSLVFAETDDDPGLIEEVYSTVSKLYGLSLPELKRKVLENFIRIFKT